ncbi:MAG: hypothetical protein KAH18_03190 [Psychromonas sp.]|nr:hypothetical protein [Psychromonas sp.]
MNEYLIRAESACNYVYNTVRLKTLNRHEGINKTQSVSEHNSLITQFKQDRKDLKSENWSWCYEFIESRARRTEKSKVGVCDENAAHAFKYLYLRGERGMALMNINNIHLIVLLGLKKKPPNISPIWIGARCPDEWGEDAVVCDPWYQEWFIAKEKWHMRIDCLMGFGVANTFCKHFDPFVECMFYL